MTLRNIFIAIFALCLQTNHPPVVKIGSPANQSHIAAGAQLSYEVQVTDQEDGDSRYDEIDTKAVLLELTRLKPGARVPPPNAHAATDPGLDIMAGNNCFNCHLFKGKALGPSFFDIATHYPTTTANIDTLVRRVGAGSSGIWPGSEKMPSHPELSAAAIRSTVQWILHNGAREDRSFFNGTTGLLRFPADKPGTYILTASYTDHGLKDLPTPHLKGSDRVIVIVQ
jgi:cytochrome c